VLTWQEDGSLAAAPVGQAAAAVLAANGFIHDRQAGVYRLSADDTTAQARAVRETGRQLRAHGIDAALQHPSGKIPTTSTPPVPVAPRAPAARTR
jgi:hypothetical protein